MTFLKKGLRPVLFLSLSLVTLAGFQSKQETTYVIATIPKNTNPLHKLRLSGSRDDLVVSRQQPKVFNALRKINVSPDEDLYVVELNSADEASLPAEAFRIGRFAVVKLWQQEEPELHLGDIKNFVVKVDGSVNDEILPVSDSKAKTLTFRREPVVSDISEDQLKTWLSEFSGAKDTALPSGNTTIRERGSQNGKNQAREWLKQEYEKLGFTISLHEYATGKNFVAQRPGLDTSKTLIVSAHLDSVGNAGADDDGAGTISALAIAKSLEGHSLKYNLRVVGFDEEERGLIGSKAYAKYLNDKGELASVVGVINVEMTGYDADNDGAFHAIHCDENTSKVLADAVASAVSVNNLNLKLEDACTNRSDHAAFWRYRAPAIVISQNFFGGDSNPCYHQSCDKVDKINFSYMTELTKAIAIATNNLLVAPGPAR